MAQPHSNSASSTNSRQVSSNQVDEQTQDDPDEQSCCVTLPQHMLQNVQQIVQNVNEYCGQVDCGNDCVAGAQQTAGGVNLLAAATTALLGQPGPALFHLMMGVVNCNGATQIRRYGNLSQQTARFGEQNEQLSKNNANLAEEVERLREQNNGLKKQAAWLEHQNASLSHSVAKAAEENAKHAQWNKELEELINRGGSALQQHYQNLRNIDSQLTIATRNLQNTERTYAARQASLAVVDAQLIQRNRDLLGVKKQFVTERLKLKETNQKLKETSQGLALREREIRNANAELNAIKTQLAERTSELGDVEERLAEQVTNLENLVRKLNYAGQKSTCSRTTQTL
jgi:predicted  nucleic acid-binding Zn-ribbon protein